MYFMYVRVGLYSQNVILDIALFLHMPELGNGHLEIEKRFLRFAVSEERMYETLRLYSEVS